MQRSAVRDALNQFREPWALFQRKTHVHAINYELAMLNTPLPEAVHVITELSTFIDCHFSGSSLLIG